MGLGHDADCRHLGKDKVTQEIQNQPFKTEGVRLNIHNIIVQLSTCTTTGITTGKFVNQNVAAIK